MKTSNAALVFALLTWGGASVAAAEDLQPAQQRFVAINDAVAAALEGSANPKIDSLIATLDRRSKALCQVAPNGVIAGWQAVVAKVDEADGSIELLVSPTARLQADNLASLGDALAFSGTPKTGDMVLISGQLTLEAEHCFRQQGDLTAQALAAPVYDFALSAISLVGDGTPSPDAPGVDD